MKSTNDAPSIVPSVCDGGVGVGAGVTAYVYVRLRKQFDVRLGKFAISDTPFRSMSQHSEQT